MAKETAADKALKRSRARTEFRKELTGASADAQVKISRERGRQRRSVEKAKTTQRVIERQQSEAARVRAYQERSSIAIAQKEASREQRIQTQKDLQGLRRREQVVDSGTSAVTGTSAWSTLMLITTLFFAMIFLYIIVTNGSKFGGLAGSVGTWIAGLSTNQPLFILKNEAA